MTSPAPESQLLTVAQMGAADRGAVAAGIPGVDLMDTAGKAVALAVMERFRPQPVEIYCGPGNNGGDGFVAARYLAGAGWPVTLKAMRSADAYRGDAAHHAALWQGATEPIAEAPPAAGALVIDALFGAGLDRPLQGLPAQVVSGWQRAGAKVIAVDVPSGLDGDSGQALGDCACTAAVTVTFCRRKPGHLLLPGRGLCGEVVLADIGIPDSVVAAQEPNTFRNGPALWGSALRWRDETSHKFAFGSLLIRGGAEMTGAGRLAARAALRVGSGLVTLAAPAAALPLYALAGAAVILATCESASDWARLVGEPRRSAFLVGPGNGLGEDTRAAALSALASGRACLLDADAISVFAGEEETLAKARGGPLVITPHEGEFARLFPNLSGSRIQRAPAAARLIGGVVVLKGSDTIIASPDGRVAINDNAPPSLAVAGAGDVLSGLIAGLLSQGLDAFEAAAAGVWLHGAAAGEATTAGLMADDLPDRLPNVLLALKSDEAPR